MAERNRPACFTGTNAKFGPDYKIRFEGANMASESIYKSVDTLPMTAKRPKLIVIRDMNDYPANARCSSCGQAMPVRRRWITSSADNLVWFADQFRLHVEKEHPAWSGTRKNSKGLSDIEAA
jgi:hypothetical protein